uniref:Transmembrane protein n=1 Tax=Shewanella sp. (strain MR-7) TaxID=60481 RepID=Q0HT49_SHESR
MNEPYRSFAEFYPFYLSQHQDLSCRRLHFIGSFLVILLFVAALIFANGWLLLFIPLVGYGFAWVGHFVFEHNHPATFQYPLYSLMGDWVMFAQILTGKLKC